MNPEVAAMEVHAYYRRIAQEAKQARQDELHRAAVARRRKAKRGGKR